MYSFQIVSFFSTSVPKLLNYVGSVPPLNVGANNKFSTVHVSDVGPTVQVTFEVPMFLHNISSTISALNFLHFDGVHE